MQFLDCTAFFSRILGRIFRNKTGAVGMDICSSWTALRTFQPHFGLHFSESNRSSLDGYLHFQGCTPHFSAAVWAAFFGIKLEQLGWILTVPGCTPHFSATFWAAFFGIKPEQLAWISAVPGLQSTFLGRIFWNKTRAVGMDICSSWTALHIFGPHFSE